MPFAILSFVFCPFTYVANSHNNNDTHETNQTFHDRLAIVGRFFLLLSATAAK